MTKVCSKCKEEKSLEMFFKDKGFKDGYYSRCKVCKTNSTLGYRAKKKEFYNNYMRKYRKQHPAKYQKERVRSLRNRYGITQAQYDNMLRTQNGSCALCPAKPGKKPLHIDHNHKTGKVRGLLCASHNRSLALLDDIELLDKAIDYVEKSHKSYSGWGCDCCGKADQPYMLLDQIWESITKDSKERFLCLHCVEERLGRSLQLNDFTSASINNGALGFSAENYLKKSA